VGPVSTKRSDPRPYQLPPQTVFGALLAALPQTKLKITGHDPQQGTIWASKSASMMSWGEDVVIYVQPAGPNQSVVTVDSKLKFGFVAWGAHDKNFRRVFEALDGAFAANYSPSQPPG
jgi:hypothetical protein